MHVCRGNTTGVPLYCMLAVGMDDAGFNVSCCQHHFALVDHASLI
jgi:hypothetical protein